MSKVSRSGASPNQVSEIRKQCDDLIESLSKKTGLSKSQIAKEIHYRIQREKSYRINPNKREKAASLKRHGNCCSIKGPNCNGKQEEFHHIRRDVANPHSPDNMVPICEPCHGGLTEQADEK